MREGEASGRAGTVQAPNAGVVRTMALVAALGSVTAAVVLLLAALLGGSDLRNGLVPVSLGALAGSGGLTLLAARTAGVGSQSRWASPLAGVTGLALLAVAGFFFSLAVLSLVDSDLLRSDTVLTAAGTLLACSSTALRR